MRVLKPRATIQGAFCWELPVGLYERSGRAGSLVLLRYLPTGRTYPVAERDLERAMAMGFLCEEKTTKTEEKK